MVERVDRWLDSLGLGKYATLFAENEITSDVLPDLTETDLEKLGLPLGARKKIIMAASALPPATDLNRPPGLAEAPAAVTPFSPAQAERRQLTVMFVDLVGSTALSGRLDPEEMADLLRAYQNAVAGEIARFEGHVAKFMGDGVLAYFGWPKAHEDEAERAVRAGLAVRDAVGRLHYGGAELACRIGIATGLVVVGELIGEGSAKEEAVVGETPNLAARLQAQAAPSQIVIADATRRLLGGGFTVIALGEPRLKGIDRPVGAFAVSGERAVRSRFDARVERLQPMVGREQELALLLECWARARGGQGQGVLLVGEPGIGKSRIVRALSDAVDGEPQIGISYQCSPYHTQSALWPVIQQLSNAAVLADRDTVDKKLDALEAIVPAAGNDRNLLAQLVGIDASARYGALGLTPAQIRAQTLGTLVNQTLGMATSAPVLMMVEDIHWTDPTTLEFIRLTLDAIQRARVLCVLTSRLDGTPELAGHPLVTRLTLNRLGHSGVEAIIARLVGSHLPTATTDAIVARTDGVPLFVEELTKAVIESGSLAVPASLHDSLMARLDAVSGVREVAQVASCIGREFTYQLLANIVDRSEQELMQALDKLVSAELIFRRSAPPNVHYVFKHALVQESAYQSILKQQRQELHIRLLRHFESSGSAASEILARHAEAGKLIEDALRYRSAAADSALQKSANVEAVGHYQAALELLRELPDNRNRDQLELKLQLGLGAASIAPKSYGSEDVRNAFARAVEICDDDTHTELRFRALRGLWNWNLMQVRLDECMQLSCKINDLADPLSDSSFCLMASRIAGTTELAYGRYVSARAFSDHSKSYPAAWK